MNKLPHYFLLMRQISKPKPAPITATAIEDAKKLVEAGFEYVTEINRVKLFRKRK